MATTSQFRIEYAKQKREIERLTRLIADLEVLNFAGNNANIWSGFTQRNRHRLHTLSRARNRNPNNYNLNNLSRKKTNAEQKTKALLWSYGYLPKRGLNWVQFGGLRAPPTMPWSEVPTFLTSARRRLNGTASVTTLEAHSSMNRFRQKLNNAGILKPVIHGPRRRPIPAATPKRGRYVPESLQEVAWASPNFKFWRNLSNNNFERESQTLDPTLVNLYKRLRARYRYRNRSNPNKPRRYPKLFHEEIERHRRNAAARALQYAAKKWIQRRRK